MRSKYIVIEGLEGAGKTTARNVVVDTLTSLGVADMVFTREPGGTQLAENCAARFWISNPLAMKLLPTKRKC